MSEQQNEINISRSKFADIINEFTYETNISNTTRLIYIKKICEEFVHRQTTQIERNISTIITAIKNSCTHALGKNNDTSTIVLLYIFHGVKNLATFDDYVGKTCQLIKLLVTELH